MGNLKQRFEALAARQGETVTIDGVGEVLLRQPSHVEAESVTPTEEQRADDGWLWFFTVSAHVRDPQEPDERIFPPTEEGKALFDSLPATVSQALMRAVASFRQRSLSAQVVTEDPKTGQKKRGSARRSKRRT